MIEALYLHIPYCKQKCAYCNFYSQEVGESGAGFQKARANRECVGDTRYDPAPSPVVRANRVRVDDANCRQSDPLESKACDESTFDTIDSYIDNLCCRIKEVGKAGLLTNLKTLYLGGGTPSLLTPEQLEAILTSVHGALDSAQLAQPHAPQAHTSQIQAPQHQTTRDQRKQPKTVQPQTVQPQTVQPQASQTNPNTFLPEITVEANPESLTPAFLDTCKEHGVTRISLGIQSMEDTELAAVGRLACAKDNERALKLLQGYPFAVSVDVIVGLPGQTPATLEKTIRQLLIHEQIKHVSVYPLSVEKGTPLYVRQQEGTVEIPDEDKQALLLERAGTLLRKNGFCHYEVANYARPGFEAKHNVAYWTEKEYLGLGPTASSMVARNTYQQICAVLPGLPVVSIFPDEIARIRFTETAADHRAYKLEGLTYEQCVAEDLMLASRLAKGLDEAMIRRAQDALGAKRVNAALRDLGDQGFLQQPRDKKENYFETPLTPTSKGWLLGNVMFSSLWDLAPTTKTFTAHSCSANKA